MVNAPPDRVATSRLTLADSVADLESDLARRLNTPSSRRRFWLLASRVDPEVVRVWGRIQESLSDLALLLVRTNVAQHGADAKLASLLRSKPVDREQWTLAFARSFDHALRAVVPLFADEAYLRSTILTAKTSKRLQKSFGAERAKQIERLVENGELDSRKVETLAFALRRVALDRANKRRKDHARTAVRSELLKRMLGPLLIMVAITTFVFAKADDGKAWSVVVALTSGALGSILSGSFRLRDEVTRLTDLRAFSPGVWVQPLLGAAAGLFAFLIVRAGLLRLPSTADVASVTGYGVYGFLAGFSEPFLLGIVKRLSADPGPTTASAKQ